MNSQSSERIITTEIRDTLNQIMGQIKKEKLFSFQFGFDFKNVEDKIKTGHYKSVSQWINDMKELGSSSTAFLDQIKEYYLKKIGKYEKLLENKNNRNFEQNIINKYNELMELLMNPPKGSDKWPRFEARRNHDLDPFTRTRINNIIDKLNVISKNNTQKEEVLEIIKKHEINEILHENVVDLSYASRALLIELENYILTHSH